MVRVYLDTLILLLVASFALDSVTLWAVAQIRGVSITPGRLTAGAAVTSIAFLFFVLLRDIGLLDLSSPLSMAAALGASLIAVAIAFPKLRLAEVGRITVYRYLLAAMACGVAVAVRQMTGDPASPPALRRLPQSSSLPRPAGGAVHRGLRDGVLLVPVTVSFGDSDVRFDALVDTGNRLRDPISGAPAIIVELDALASVLPVELVQALRAWDGGDAAGSVAVGGDAGVGGSVGEDVEAGNNRGACGAVGFEALSDAAAAIARTQWSSRFRLVPYSSVGNERGIMAAFRPDSVQVSDGIGTVFTSRAIVCVCCSQLSPEGRYRGLVNPDIFRAA